MNEGIVLGIAAIALVGFALISFGGLIEYKIGTEPLGDMICSEQYGEGTTFSNYEEGVVTCQEPEVTQRFDGGKTRIVGRTD